MNKQTLEDRSLQFEFSLKLYVRVRAMWGDEFNQVTVVY